MDWTLKQLFTGLLLVVTVCTGLTSASSLREACVEDFSPCVCTKSRYTYVDCIGVYGVDIREVFKRTTTSPSYLTIHVPDDCGFLPADMLNGKSVSSLTISGNNCSLMIDSNAFTSTLGSPYTLAFYSLNLKFLDFSFLQGFSDLRNLYIGDCSDVHTLKYLPNLAAIQELRVDKSTGGNDKLNDFPTGRSFTQLYRIRWTNGDLNDKAAKAIFDAIAQSPSNNVLAYVHLENNKMTQMPTALANFPRMEFLNLTENSISVVKTGSVLFHYRPPGYLNLKMNPIVNVEPGAFVGLGHASVYFSNHSMTRLPADVFLPVLEEMTLAGGALIYDDRNQFECDCHLAWLVRDHQHLLQQNYAVRDARCQDGRKFQELDPADYAFC